MAGDEKIYNQVAFEVMKELAVPIDDLCAYVAEQQKKVPPRPLSELPTPPQRAGFLRRGLAEGIIVLLHRGKSNIL